MPRGKEHAGCFVCGCRATTTRWVEGDQISVCEADACMIDTAGLNRLEERQLAIGLEELAHVRSLM